MRARTVALALVVGASLSAQVYITTGDMHLTLAQVLRLHPEGEVLSLPNTQGQSIGPAIQSVLGEEPALSLQLTGQELERNQPVGRELAALGNGDATRPHWALVGPDRHIVAEGTEPPTAAMLVEAYGRSSLRTQADTLRSFLREHPDQGIALAQLVLQVRDLAERRMEKVLASLPPGKRNAPLKDEEDDRIWTEYAELYQRLMDQGHWRDANWDASSPIPLAAQLSGMAKQSPQLITLAQRLMPLVVESLRAKASDVSRWNIWLSLRAAGAHGTASAVLVGIEPLPGARRWPPEAAVDAFVEDAQQSGDWHEAEPVLKASFDQNEELLKRLLQAAKEEAGTKVDMGNAFGFGSWNGDTALLVEAELHLGKLEEADRIFQMVFARAPKSAYALAASQLAKTCGASALAEKWAAQGK